MAKQRADLMLVALGLVESRAKAQALIMAGLVYAGTARVQKAGDMLPEGAALSVKGQEHPWVSRGGVKLAHGLEHFGFDPAGRVGLDVGASTGGFTDVLLTHGAAHVYAVDVGHGQLAWKLRSDARVTVLEKTNARHLTAEIIPAPVGALVCDASFIGLQIVLAGGNGALRAGGVRGGADQTAIRGRARACRQRRSCAGPCRACGGVCEDRGMVGGLAGLAACLAWNAARSPAPKAM